MGNAADNQNINNNWTMLVARNNFIHSLNGTVNLFNILSYNRWIFIYFFLCFDFVQNRILSLLYAVYLVFTGVFISLFIWVVTILYLHMLWIYVIVHTWIMSIYDDCLKKSLLSISSNSMHNTSNFQCQKVIPWS